jgi:SAM-dependent methyltransferase
VKQTSRSPDCSAAGAYDVLAPVYDDFTSHHDYELWLGNLMPALRCRGLKGHRLLDVACGTGKSFLPMLTRGWEVTACDISPAMLALARAKAGDTARLSLADMRDLPAFGEFDLVWALGDALNYQFTFEDLASALRGMGANLAPEGLLLFDVSGLVQFRRFFTATEVVERGGRRMIWRGQTPADVTAGSICEAHFEVVPLPGEDGTVETDLHRQRHHPESKVLSALDVAGLECLDLFGHGYDAVLQQPFDDLVHPKAIYIARRKRPRQDSNLRPAA